MWCASYTPWSVGALAAVEKIMTAVVSTCTSQTRSNSLTLLMTEHRVRHVPVLEDGKLIGIVSIGDVVKTADARAGK